MACIFKKHQMGAALPNSSSLLWHSLGADLLKCTASLGQCVQMVSNIWVLEELLPELRLTWWSPGVPEGMESHIKFEESSVCTAGVRTLKAKRSTESNYLNNCLNEPSFISSFRRAYEGRDLIWDVWGAVPLLHFASQYSHSLDNNGS